MLIRIVMGCDMKIRRYVSVFVLFFVFLFKTGSHCVVLAGLEFSV